jgi:glucokinase
MAGLVAAIDLGGTAMKGALARDDGVLEDARTRPTGADSGAEAVLERLETLAGELIADATQPVAALGVAVPGLVDEAHGVARAAVNLGWRDVPLRDRLRARCGLPVAVAHDVRAAARAEGALGAARGCRDWLLITLGTGVGGAVVVGGRPLAGAHGAAGELGHVVVRPEGPPCACGARGCVEVFASAGGIERRYGSGDSAKTIAGRAAAGEERASTIWREAIDALAAGLATAVMLFDPERIVVGGGLAGAGPTLLEPLAAALSDQLTVTDAPPIAPAVLGPEAGCHGAALVARDALA